VIGGAKGTLAAAGAASAMAAATADT